MRDFEISRDGMLWAYHGNTRNVVIPKNVRVIRSYAFSGNTVMQSVTIPESVTAIEAEAFYRCRQLREIFIPKRVSTIGENVFSGCAELEKVQVSFLNQNYMSYDDILYDKRSGTLIKCPSQKKSAAVWKKTEHIATNAFLDCSLLKEVTLPEGVTSIGEQAFHSCSGLTEINLPAQLTEINDSVFSGCRSLKQIIIPAQVTRIGERAFLGCRELKEISIPQSVTLIQKYAFWWTGLNKITLPDKLCLGKKAFYDCMNLKTVIYKNQEYAVNYGELIYLLKFLGLKENVPKMNPLKCHALLGLYFQKPENPEIEYYVKCAFDSMIPFLFDEKNLNLLRNIIEQKIFIRKSNIDKLIQNSIDHKTPEFTLMLINYKNDNIGYESQEEIIRRKFDL